LKEPTDPNPGTSAAWGAPDAVQCAQLIKGTYPGQAIPEAAIKNTAMTLGTSSQVITGAKIFNNTILQINNPALTFQYKVNSSAILANINVTLPLLVSDDTFVFANFVQTLTNKTIDGGSNSLANIASASIVTRLSSKDLADSTTISNVSATSKAIAFTLSGMTSSVVLTISSTQSTSQTLSIPNITGADTLVTTGLAQTIAGVKTYSGGITMSGANLAMGTNSITGNFSVTGQPSFKDYVTMQPATDTIYGLIFANNSGTPKWWTGVLNNANGNAYHIYDAVNGELKVQIDIGGNVRILNANLTIAATQIFSFNSGLTSYFTETSAGQIDTFANLIQAYRVVVGATTTTEVNNVFGRLGALATNTADGFAYMPSGAGTPTGTPTAFTGKVAFYYDTTNNIIYIYNGAWKKTAALT